MSLVSPGGNTVHRSAECPMGELTIRAEALREGLDRPWRPESDNDR